MSKVTKTLGNHKKLIIVLAVILVLIVGLVLFLTLSRPTDVATQEGSTVRLVRMDIEQTVTATGTVSGINSHSVTSAQTGKISSVSAEVGQVVKAGETLCVFDTSALDLSITSTQSSLETAKAQQYESLSQAEDAVSRAYDQYNYDKARLDTEVQKAWDALEAAKAAKAAAVPSSTGATPGATSGAAPGPTSGVAPEATAETTDPIPALQAAHDTAVSTRTATLRTDSTAITNAENALASQRLMDTTTSLQAQLDGYLQQKEDATVRAPIDGTITTANAKVNGYADMQAPLFIIENLAQLEVIVSVPEYDATRLLPNLSAHFSSDALQGDQWEGAVKSISPVASDKNFTATILVTSPLGGLKSGMSTKVNIVCASSKNTFAVPYGALSKNGAGETIISVIDEESSADSEAKRREISVTTGLETDYYIEIASPSLQEGLLVDIDPDHLTSGTPSNSIMNTL